MVYLRILLIYFFLRENFIRKSTKSKLLTNYTCMYITTTSCSRIQALYIIQNEGLTTDIKHLSNGQLSRKVVQLIYVGYPRLMQIY